MPQNPAIAAYARHVNPTMVRLLGLLGYGRVFVKGKGARLWDDQGREYLDLLASFGAANLGHNHPRLCSRLAAFFSEDAVQFPHVAPSTHAAALAEALAKRAGAPLEVSLFANSGTEAIEAAIKIARAYTRRAGFLSCEGGYHGTTLGALSLMGHERMRKPFEPLFPGCRRIPFGDLDALSDAVAKKDVAAFVLEPILAEGGVVLPPPGYLAAAAEICRRHGTLFVLDEVQTGLGRTGTLFGYQQEGVVPDVVVLAKSLGGGIAPIAAAITTGEIFHKAYGKLDRYDAQGSTFAGGAFAATAALETLAILDDEGLVARAASTGAKLLASLKERLAAHPLVREVRGRGLLIAIDIGPTGQGMLNRLAPALVSLASQQVLGQWISLRLLEKGVVCQTATHAWNVLKVEPPLVLEEADIPRAVAAIGETLDECTSVPGVLLEAGKRMRAQARAGWPFR